VIEAAKVCAPAQPKDIRNLDRRLPVTADGEPMSLAAFCKHIDATIGSALSGTAYERLWLIYLLLNKEASGVEKLEVDHEDPSNNSPLGFCSLTVRQPVFHRAVVEMINKHRAWSKRLGKSLPDKRAITTPVYEVLRQMGIAPVPRSRGPPDTDPGPRDFLYSTKYVYHKDKYFRTVYRTLKNGIYIGREETMKMHFQYSEDDPSGEGRSLPPPPPGTAFRDVGGGIKGGEGEIGAVARVVGLVGGAGGAVGGGAGNAMSADEMGASEAGRALDAKRKEKKARVRKPSSPAVVPPTKESEEAMALESLKREKAAKDANASASGKDSPTSRAAAKRQKMSPGLGVIGGFVVHPLVDQPILGSGDENRGIEVFFI